MGEGGGGWEEGGRLRGEGVCGLRAGGGGGLRAGGGEWDEGRGRRVG